MTIHFGVEFDGGVLHPEQGAAPLPFYAGPMRLLHWLEEQLGLTGYSDHTDYLRIELYRQALGQVGADFYADSYDADRFATAAFLLQWRDELLSSGWDFQAAEDAPERLKAIAAVEQIFRKKRQEGGWETATFGIADRMEQVLYWLGLKPVPADRLVLYEPLELLSPWMQRLVGVLSNKPQHCSVEEAGRPFEAWNKDRRLFVLHCRRDSDAAVYLAQILRENNGINPCFIAPQPSLALEQSLISEAFPAMGIASSSLARPSLQALKLAPIFLWEPVDVVKVMEFLTLPNKPLDAGLAQEIARVMAGKPGFFSDTWFAAVFGYLEKDDLPATVRGEYEFWFNRKRYPADSTAPVKDAVAIYSFLQQWALRNHEDGLGPGSSMLGLAEQARRIRELLEALPESRISFLELERIVRTIFEAAPMQLASEECGGFLFVQKPGALAKPVDSLIWWNFHAQNDAPPPEKWQRAERQWLLERGVALPHPRTHTRREQWLQQQPFRWPLQQLMLVIPSMVNGVETLPNLLLSDLEITLGKEAFAAATFDLDQPEDRARLKKVLRVPERQQITSKSFNRPRPYLQIETPERLVASEYETATQLESLFYYPHRWFFRQKLRLFPSSLLSITRDATLLGSLAHRFFELLLKEDLSELDKTAVFQWVDAKANELLPKEGATLLLYGREPERNMFLNRVKNAAWSLISLLRVNQWKVESTELDLQGEIGGIPIRGKADLVLFREGERAIVDLKWSGANRRKELIMNKEDLQLVLYGKLLPPEDYWPHSAYFILEEGKLIARNARAFREAILAGRNLEEHEVICAEIFDRMVKTLHWRMKQIAAGKIELRTARTVLELEAMYEGQLLDLLEMKQEDARWDDYRNLLSAG